MLASLCESTGRGEVVEWHKEHRRNMEVHLRCLGIALVHGCIAHRHFAQQICPTTSTPAVSRLNFGFGEHAPSTPLLSLTGLDCIALEVQQILD